LARLDTVRQIKKRESKVMKNAIVTISSVSPLSWSKYHKTPKLERESGEAYEARTWREKIHKDDQGKVFIPPMAFKNCLVSIAKYLSMQIKGQGKKTYTAKFSSGIMIAEPVFLNNGNKPITIDGLIQETLFVPSQGANKGGSRVEKTFPLIKEWQCSVYCHILDEIITKDIFAKHFEEAGRFIGVGRFRPENNGYYGRFEVIDVDWE